MRDPIRILVRVIYVLFGLAAGLVLLVFHLLSADSKTQSGLPIILSLGVTLGVCFCAFRCLKNMTDKIAVGQEELRRYIKELELLVDKDRLINVSMKEAQYLALQNQINPHFLYNTLEGIRSEALIAGIDSIAEMTEALATFFRYTISHLDRLVTLEEELENVENYFYIQQFRFGEKLHLSMEYEHDEDISQPEILNFHLPKLTLQPIVENAIFHGIEKNIGIGIIRIRIGVTDRRLFIRVSDNGVGMEEDKLIRLNEKLGRLHLENEKKENGHNRGGIALINVNNRLKLLFGEEYGLYVYSNVGAGTDVEISLPLVREKDEKRDTEDS